jgi:hypothetical protein
LTIVDKVAQITESPGFVTFNAHCWFACTWTFLLLHVSHNRPWTLAGLLLLAAWKEFWFDIHYETTPPQTFADGWSDFVGYATGIVLGTLLEVLVRCLS